MGSHGSGQGRNNYRPYNFGYGTWVTGSGYLRLWPALEATQDERLKGDKGTTHK